MSQTLNTVAFTPFRTLPDSNVLASSQNTASIKDTLTLQRVFPKPTKDFRGVARPAVKRVKTSTLDDGTKHDNIITLSGSIAVGTPEADILALLDDVFDAAGMQFVKDLFTKLSIAG